MPQLNQQDIMFCNAVLKLELLTKDYVSLFVNQYVESTGRESQSLSDHLVKSGAISTQQMETIRQIVEYAPAFVSNHGFMNEDGEFVKAVDKSVSAQITPNSSILQKGDYGNYSIVDVIGNGGLGIVMRGIDRSLSRDIAIKELHGKQKKKQNGSSLAGHTPTTVSPEDRRRELLRFLNEAIITGQLQHPGIVPIYRLGLHRDGTLFYAMKYVKGRPMELNLDQSKSLDDPVASFQKRMLQLVPLIEVCYAVAFAHAKGVIHRDLKPDNIVVGPHGEAVILDWGLAKKIKLGAGDLDADSVQSSLKSGDDEELVDVPDSANLSMDGEVIGSPGYIAPEALVAQGEVGPPTDVYALGTILYQILTGRLPYQYTNVENLLQKKGNLLAPTAPSEVNPDCPPELEAICLKAINVSPSLRYAHAGQLADELRAFQEGKLVKTYNYAPFERLKLRMGRHKKISAILIVMVGLLFVAMLVGVHYGVQAHAAALDAERREREVSLANNWSERMGRSMRQALDRLPDIQNDCLVRSLMVTQSFRSFFSNLDGNMQLSAKEVGLQENWTTASLSDALKKVMSYEVLMSDAIIVDRQGLVVGAYPEAFNYLYGKNFSTRSHVQRVLTEGIPVLSTLYKSEENFLSFSYCMPVFKNGEVAGSMNAFFKADDVFARLLDTKGWGGDYQYFRVRMLQSDGVMMYDSHNKALVGQNMISVEQDRGRPYRTGFFRRVLSNEMGIGKYIRETEAYVRNPVVTELQEHEVCAWQTYRLDQTVWKVIVSVVFKEGDGIVMPSPARLVQE